MEQNRKSAERSRLRKKELEQRYRAAVRQLSEENAELRRQLDSFREQIQRMQQLLAVQMRATSAPLDTPSQQ
jgi:multidrug resistance efflux pump